MLSLKTIFLLVSSGWFSKVIADTSQLPRQHIKNNEVKQLLEEEGLAQQFNAQQNEILQQILHEYNQINNEVEQLTQRVKDFSQRLGNVQKRLPSEVNLSQALAQNVVSTSNNIQAQNRRGNVTPERQLHNAGVFRQRLLELANHLIIVLKYYAEVQRLQEQSAVKKRLSQEQSVLKRPAQEELREEQPALKRLVKQQIVSNMRQDSYLQPGGGGGQNLQSSNNVQSQGRLANDFKNQVIQGRGYEKNQGGGQGERGYGGQGNKSFGNVRGPG